MPNYQHHLGQVSECGTQNINSLDNANMMPNGMVMTIYKNSQMGDKNFTT